MVRGMSPRRIAVGTCAGIVAAAIVLGLPSGASLAWPLAIVCGAASGALFAASLGRRSLAAGSALVWALGYAFLAWVVVRGIASLASHPNDGTMLDVARANFPLLASMLVAAVPLGVAVGAAAPLREPGERRFNLVRAVFAGGFAGIVGGWAFGKWMEQAGFFPLVATLVGSHATHVGVTIHFAIAAIIGVSFGILFQRDVRGLGSSLCWGVAYGMLWWFVGALTLLPLLTGHAPDYATARAGALFGSFVGHVVYGAIVGALYALVDGTWIWLFERSDPLAREPRGPGTLVASSLARGAVASVGGGLLFSLIMIATGELTTVARLVGGTSAALGFVVHLVIASIIGATYGLLFHDEAVDEASALGWGAAYGTIWWFVGALTLFPILLGRPFVWTTAAAHAQLPSLVGHIAYGVALAIAFRALERRARIERDVDERLRRRRERRLRPPGTPAPATWLFIVGMTAIVTIVAGDTFQGSTGGRTPAPLGARAAPETISDVVLGERWLSSAERAIARRSNAQHGATLGCSKTKGTRPRAALPGHCRTTHPSSTPQISPQRTMPTTRRG